MELRCIQFSAQTDGWLTRDTTVKPGVECALILPRCTQESVVIYGHLLRYCEGAKYWYCNTAKVLVFVLQY